MTIKSFIEKAIEGGYWEYPPALDDLLDGNFHKVLLDPEAWKAVGKVEGWKGETSFWGCLSCDDEALWMPTWKYKWHRMIDALAGGETIEQYLETL